MRLTAEPKCCLGPQKAFLLVAGCGRVRLPGVSVVDELVVCKAQGDGVCEVWSIAVINNPDRPASTLEPRSHT